MEVVASAGADAVGVVAVAGGVDAVDEDAAAAAAHPAGFGPALGPGLRCTTRPESVSWHTLLRLSLFLS